MTPTDDVCNDIDIIIVEMVNGLVNGPQATGDEVTGTTLVADPLLFNIKLEQVLAAGGDDHAEFVVGTFPKIGFEYKHWTALVGNYNMTDAVKMRLYKQYELTQEIVEMCGIPLTAAVYDILNKNGCLDSAFVPCGSAHSLNDSIRRCECLSFILRAVAGSGLDRVVSNAAAAELSPGNWAALFQNPHLSPQDVDKVCVAFKITKEAIETHDVPLTEGIIDMWDREGMHADVSDDEFDAFIMGRATDACANYIAQRFEEYIETQPSSPDNDATELRDGQWIALFKNPNGIRAATLDRFIRVFGLSIADAKRLNLAAYVGDDNRLEVLTRLARCHSDLLGLFTIHNSIEEIYHACKTVDARFAARRLASSILLNATGHEYAKFSRCVESDVCSDVHGNICDDIFRNSGDIIDVTLIAGDGNCLYRSVAHQLKWGKNKYDEKGVAVAGTVSYIRNSVADHIVAHRDRFAPFIDCRCDGAECVANCFERYIVRIRTPGVWGGELEITALEELLDRNILIYDIHDRSDSNIFRINLRPRDGLIVDREPLRLLYVGDCHYNSLHWGDSIKPHVITGTTSIIDSKSSNMSNNAALVRDGSDNSFDYCLSDVIARVKLSPVNIENIFKYTAVDKDDVSHMIELVKSAEDGCDAV